MEESPLATILVVDDKPENLQLLSQILGRAGYRVQVVGDGRAALHASLLDPPDLILLDIMMPEMDGYELCRQFKAAPPTRNVPIIFISALSSPFDKAHAFAAGGIDYITRPFQAEEVLAHVQTHLTIRSLQQDLLDQIAELDAFAHTVAHDLKNPLSLIIGFTELLSLDNETMPAAQRAELLQNVLKSGYKAVNIIDELLLLSSVRKQDVPLQPVNMGRIVQNAQKRLSLMVTEYEACIVLPDEWPMASGHAPWLEEVWVNYLSNAIKYGGRPPCAELGADRLPDGTVRYWVKDNGPGLTAEQQTRLFAEFTRLDKIRADGHGLGLSIVRRIMDKLGGTVGVESEPGAGSTFYFTLPASP
ncbi:MAG TPA: hybrid sensor histidine kinase/response regulator [Chloroflexota bacterium]|nr:hybrid sensor histidine kinase/response regulator [Chloroflexota bacterium]